MCGLVGFTGRASSAALTRALGSISYRGPDADGLFEDETVSIGHCRLAIIDPAMGHQPMHSDDGRHVLAFNGEIYNFRVLRERLESKGERFRTRSDTEVLLRWLMLHGRDGLSDLNGMFALALWDRADRRLLLARDRLGIKPLYVYEQAGAITFASEIKAILQLADVRDPDLRTIFQFVTFQNVLSDDTFFRGIKKIPPAGWLEWRESRITSGRFWNLAFERIGRSFEETVDEYRATLDRAVSRHMIADVPVGTYLSGGLDSGSVTVLAARQTAGAIHTFTGAFRDAPYYDERPGSRAVARRAGAQLHEIEIEPEDFCRNFGRVMFHLDEPTLGTGALPQFVVAQLAARHVKVVLTGHGGDEMFAGYQVSKAILLRDLLFRRPFAAATHLARVRPDEWSRILYFLLFPLLQPEVGHGLFIMTPRNRRKERLSAAFLSSVKDYEPLEEVPRLLSPGMTRAEALQALYLKTYLPTLFIQEDKIGMAHSLESRMPLCDNELIELALRIPFEQKLHGGTLKAIPKAAMRLDLPDLLYSLPKRGFPTPFARWFRVSNVRSLIEELLLSPRARQRSLFEPGYVSKVWQAHLSSRTDTLFDYARASELYSMAAVEQWFRTFVDQPTPQPLS